MKLDTMKFTVRPCNESDGSRTWDIVEITHNRVVENCSRRKLARAEARKRNEQVRRESSR